MTTIADSLMTRLTAAVRPYTERLLPDLSAVAVLEGDGNVIAVLEVRSPTDAPRELLREVVVAVCAVDCTPRIDGVLYLNPRHERGVRMTFFDRDGTWEAMCGNGLRCATRYAFDRGYIGEGDRIVTDDGIKPVSVTGSRVSVTIGSAREVQRLDSDRWFAYTGVAHLVVFTSDPVRLEQIDVPVEGARLRYDAELCRRLGHAEGVHVDFVAPEGDGLAIRTYEVGVEDETLCCGTGAAAAAHLAAHTGRVRLPCRLRARGGVVEVGVQDDALMLTGSVGYLLPVQPLRGAEVATGEGWVAR